MRKSGSTLGALLLMAQAACSDGAEQDADAALDAARGSVISEAGVCLEFCSSASDASLSDGSTARDASSALLDAAQAKDDAGPCVTDTESFARACSQSDECTSLSLGSCCSHNHRKGLSQTGLAAFQATLFCRQECMTDCIKPTGERDDNGRPIGDAGFSLECVQGLCTTRSKLSLP